MKSFLRTAIASVAVAATTLTALPSANAGERWHRHRHHSRDSDLAVAGLLGLAAGALVAGIATRPAYGDVYAPRRYRDYRVGYVEPQVVYVDDYGTMEPWTPEWYAYCSDRYRSFNSRSGTFTGYDGQQHFCVVN
jgi:hypothetical protein